MLQLCPAVSDHFLHFHALNETCNLLGCQVVNDSGRRIILLRQTEKRSNTCSTNPRAPVHQHNGAMKRGE